MSESLAYTEAAARLAEERVQFDASQHQWDQAARDRLVSAGFSGSEAQTAVGILRSHPEAGLKIAAAVDLGVGEASRQNPFVQSVWMFITDLFAAAIPVIPFAFFALATARIVSLSVTLILLILLGIGRSMIGHRRLLPTVTETIVIAATAAAAGLAVGKLIA
jgi:vacuolar iron transporter family protein